MGSLKLIEIPHCEGVLNIALEKYQSVLEDSNSSNA